MKVIIHPKHTVVWCCEKHYEEVTSKDAELTHLQHRVMMLEHVVDTLSERQYRHLFRAVGGQAALKKKVDAP